MIQLKDVQEARSRIAPYIVRTPLLRTPALDEYLGCQVYLKHEGFQPMGAFKLRGAMNKALSLTPEERARGLVCASSGNHAQGVAYAAHALSCRAVIVMPTNANPVKLAGVKKWGGQVELVGTLSSQREARAAQLVAEEGMVEVHPYADPYVAAGQGTLALEVLRKDESNLVNDLPSLLEMLKELDHPAIGGMIDTIPMALAGERPCQYLEALGDRLVHIHFIDGAPRGHLAWGDGVLDMQGYLSELDAYPYKGYLSLEITDGRYFMDPSRSVEQSVEKLFAVL